MNGFFDNVMRKLGWSGAEERELELLEVPTEGIQGEIHMKDIVHVHVIKSNATIEASKVRELCESLDGRLPYDDECFLVQLNDYDQEDEEKVCSDADCETVNDDDARFCKSCGRRLPVNEASTLKVERLDWNGEDSGRTFHPVFIKQVAPHISGRIEAVALLQGDEDVAPKLLGFILEDGIYTKCEVDVRLRASED